MPMLASKLTNVRNRVGMLGMLRNVSLLAGGAN